MRVPSVLSTVVVTAMCHVQSHRCRLVKNRVPFRHPVQASALCLFLSHDPEHDKSTDPSDLEISKYRRAFRGPGYYSSCFRVRSMKQLPDHESHSLSLLHRV